MRKVLIAVLLLGAVVAAQVGGSSAVTNPASSSVNAIQIQGKAVDVPTAAGQQLTYDGAKFAKQDKRPIDLRDWVDCTGAADASTVLNAKTDGTQSNNWCGQDVYFNGCAVRLNHIWWVQYCAVSPRLHLGPKQGGGKIMGCIQDSAPTGMPNVPVVMFSRTGTPNIEGGSSEAWTNDAPGGCTSNATVNISVENDATTHPGGVTTTFGIFKDHLFAPRRVGTITNWIGLQIGGSTISNPNLESMTVEGNLFAGQDSLGSTGLVINSVNSDRGTARQNTFVHAKWGVAIRGPDWLFDTNSFSAIGYYPTFGGGSSIIGSISSRRLVFINNIAGEYTGQFWSAFPTDQGAADVTFIRNSFGGADIGAMNTGVPNIDCSQCIGDWTFINNTGQNFVGADIVKYKANSGVMARFHDLGNNWLSNKWTINPVTDGALEEDWTVNNSPLGLSLQSSKISQVGTSPPLDFETVQLTGNYLNRFRIASLSGRQGGQSAGVVIAQKSGTAAGTMSIGMPFGGGLVTQSSAATDAPSVVPVGGTGSTTWGYKVVLYANNGLVRTTAETTISNGVATLSSSTFNHVKVLVSAEFWKACLYRTTAGGTPSSTGLLSTAGPNSTGCVILTAGTPGYWGFGGEGDLYLTDIGTAGDATTTPATTANGSVNIPAGATYQINGMQVSAANLSNGTTGTAGTAVVLATSPALVTPNIGAATTGNQITSTLATGTAPFSITSTTPVANLTTVPTTYNHSGMQQAAVHLVQDSCTLRTNCAVTLAGSAVFTKGTSYTCACVDNTSAAACKVAQSSGTAFTITGTGTDSIRYICVGN